MGTWLQQLAAWWPPARAQAAAAVGDGAPAGAPCAAGAQVLDGLQGATASRDQTPKEHLIVMVHGLFGTRDNWRAISELLAQHLDPDTSVLFVSHCNERTKTFEGVDVCGERLAEEVRGVVARHPGLQRISLLGHSMGGLISRYAAGRLYDADSGTLAGLAPCHFVAMATPHLGCDARKNPAQVPLISWLSAVPAVGGAVQSVMSELAAPVSEMALGRAGLQFFLEDAEQEAAPKQREAGAEAGARRQDPLLYRLSKDHPDEGLLFLSALASFETRTLYANSSGDHLVGWANSSLRRLPELPPKSGRGAGVVREDPLEAAWAPDQRPRLHTSAAAEALRSGEGREVGQRAVLQAGSASQLATSSSKASAPAGGGAGEAAASTLNSTTEQQRWEGSPGLAGALDPPAGSGGSGFGSAAADARDGGAAAGATAGRGMPSRERQVEEMLSRLQSLSWRRVDVCFGATLLPLLSHQHIQMQRWWVNWPGRAVVKHLALQIQAMEQLRAQGSPQQAHRPESPQHQQEQQERPQEGLLQQEQQPALGDGCAAGWPQEQQPQPAAAEGQSLRL